MMEGLAINDLSKLLDDSREAENAKGRQFNQKPVATAPMVVQRAGAGDSSTAPKHSDNIWDDSEVPNEDALLNARDERPCPRYEISYKQSIGTEDTFLGFSDKTPLSGDCTHIVIKIHFPGSVMKDLDLDVSSNRIMAASRTLKLFTYLPTDVDESNGKAAFDKKKEVLTVTLPIVARGY